MSDSVFATRLKKIELKYRSGVPRENTERSNRKKPRLNDRALLAPSRGSTVEESLRILGEAVSQHPNDLTGQIHAFFKEVQIPASSGAGNRKGRTVSHATVEKYYHVMTLMIDDLRSLNIKPSDLTQLSYKHISIVFRHWEDKELSSSTISNRYSIIKRFFMMIGKNQAPELRAILKNPAHATRSQTLTASLDWRAKGHDANAIIGEIEQDDPRVAMILKLCYHFGLRLKEAVSFMPLENTLGSVILINKGAKGGRARVIQIETDEQRTVLEGAKRLAHLQTGCIGQSRSLSKNLTHVYSVLKEYGINKRGLGITPHGLRHSYLNQVYETITGTQSPVNGGVQIDKELDQFARREVSRRAGHTRPRIAAAYLGTHKHLNKLHRNQVLKTLELIQNDAGVKSVFAEHQRRLDQAGLSLEIKLTGPHALGQTTHESAVVLFAISIERKPGSEVDDGQDLDYQAYRVGADLEEVLANAIGHNCVLKPENRFPSDTPVLTLNFS